MYLVFAIGPYWAFTVGEIYHELTRRGIMSKTESLRTLGQINTQPNSSSWRIVAEASAVAAAQAGTSASVAPASALPKRIATELLRASRGWGQSQQSLRQTQQHVLVLLDEKTYGTSETRRRLIRYVRELFAQRSASTGVAPLLSAEAMFTVLFMSPACSVTTSCSTSWRDGWLYGRFAAEYHHLLSDSAATHSGVLTNVTAPNAVDKDILTVYAAAAARAYDGKSGCVSPMLLPREPLMAEEDWDVAFRVLLRPYSALLPVNTMFSNLSSSSSTRATLLLVDLYAFSFALNDAVVCSVLERIWGNRFGFTIIVLPVLQDCSSVHAWHSVLAGAGLDMCLVHVGAAGTNVQQAQTSAPERFTEWPRDSGGRIAVYSAILHTLGTYRPLPLSVSFPASLLTRHMPEVVVLSDVRHEEEEKSGLFFSTLVVDPHDDALPLNISTLSVEENSLHSAVVTSEPLEDAGSAAGCTVRAPETWRQWWNAPDPAVWDTEGANRESLSVGSAVLSFYFLQAEQREDIVTPIQDERASSTSINVGKSSLLLDHYHATCGATTAAPTQMHFIPLLLMSSALRCVSREALERGKKWHSSNSSVCAGIHVSVWANGDAQWSVPLLHVELPLDAQKIDDAVQHTRVALFRGNVVRWHCARCQCGTHSHSSPLERDSGTPCLHILALLAYCTESRLSFPDPQGRKDPVAALPPTFAPVVTDFGVEVAAAEEALLNERSEECHTFVEHGASLITSSTAVVKEDEATDDDEDNMYGSAALQMTATKTRNETPFFCFCRLNRASVKAAYPTASFGEVTRLLGEQWRALSEAEKEMHRGQCRKYVLTAKKITKTRKRHTSADGGSRDLKRDSPRMRKASAVEVTTVSATTHAAAGPTTATCADLSDNGAEEQHIASSVRHAMARHSEWFVDGKKEWKCEWDTNTQEEEKEPQQQRSASADVVEGRRTMRAEVVPRLVSQYRGPSGSLPSSSTISPHTRIDNTQEQY